MTDPTSAGDSPAVLTEREQKLLLAAMRSLKSGPIEVDYGKFQKETGAGTIGSARASWAPLKKKLFGDANLTASSSTGGADKVAKSKGARRPKQPNAAHQNPTKAKSTPTKKILMSDAQVEESSDDNDGETEAQEDAGATLPNSSYASTIETSAPVTEVGFGNGDDESDSQLTDIAESVESDDSNLPGKTWVTAASTAQVIHGDISPPLTPTPAANTTPVKPKATPNSSRKPRKVPTQTVSPHDTPTGTVIDAPDTPTSKPHKTIAGKTAASLTPKKRKTKTEKEDEATAAVEDGENSAKKPRKTPTKKAAVMREDEDDDADNATAVAEKDVETPKTDERIKRTRKPVVKKDPATPKKQTVAQKAKADAKAEKTAAAKAQVDADAAAAEAERHAAEEQAAKNRVFAEAQQANDVLTSKMNERRGQEEGDVVQPQDKAKSKDMSGKEKDTRFKLEVPTEAKKRGKGKDTIQGAPETPKPLGSFTPINDNTDAGRSADSDTITANMGKNPEETITVAPA